MWIFNSDLNKWESNDDKLPLNEFEFLKQEQSSYRFYSKALSGSTYIPVNDLTDIFDILNYYKERNWYISVPGSQYTNTLIPSRSPKAIDGTSSFDYYQKNIKEYGLTLKNLFTPTRLIKDSLNNYIYVDVATTGQLNNIGQVIDNFRIDGIRLKEGHRVLVKDQKTTVNLLSTDNPEDFIQGNYYIVQNLGATIEYEYYNSNNGIYTFTEGRLVKANELDDYDTCKRFSVCVKEGVTNTQRQFHLSRLLDGYFPVGSKQEPFEFKEKKNWILRNRVDYNNLFEINYFDVIKHATQSYQLDGITYSIPERLISVGEFGVILNTQNDISNIIKNKYKVNLRSITQTKEYYWICGDSATLLKIRKHDFLIERIQLPDIDNKFSINLKSISFFNDLRGALVGDLNTIYVTIDGGKTWKRQRVPDFDSYYFNKVIFAKQNTFYIAGNVGVFIEMSEGLSGWTAYKRRISRFIDDEDDYLLVDNINDMLYTNINTWNLNFNFFTQSIPSDKELLFLSTDDNKIIVYDINKVNQKFDFIYLDFGNDYDDIINITRRSSTNTFYFTGINISSNDSGIFSFDINNFSSIGVGNSYSNTILGPLANYESQYFPNEIIDYEGDEIIICGNESLLYSATYSSVFNFQKPDPNFENRLKAKLLYLDYDAGSKLNFFTDFGEYRLPNSLTIDFPAFSYFYFSPLVNGATAPSYLTQSQTNWFQYWRDREQTFVYYNDLGQVESQKVEYSTVFTYSTISSVKSIFSITKELSHIKNLAPRIDQDSDSRFFRAGTTGMGFPNPVGPTVAKDLYLYDYLMVVRVATNYPVKIGDVISFNSYYVNKTFVVNRIETLTSSIGTWKYLYVFTEFNQNIITNLSTATPSATASITNLNSFTDQSQFVERFNKHPMSVGYEAVNDLDYLYGITQLKLDFNYGAQTASYTNWNFTGNFATVSSFGVSSQTYSISTSGVGNYLIETPYIQNAQNISFLYKSNGLFNSSGTFSYIKTQGLSGSTWYDLDTRVMSNGFLGNIPQLVNINLSYNYSKYRFNIRSSAATQPPFTPSYKTVVLDDIKLTSVANTPFVVEPSSYGTNSQLVTLNKLTLNPKFNNFTSYYNLSQKVETTYESYTMSYTSGFLNFGYSPTYNILDYLESINDIGDPSPIFYADKEYYAMPDYRAIPLQGTGGFTSSNAYIDENGLTFSSVNPAAYLSTTNKIIFGQDLKIEWESLHLNTFVDINLYTSVTYSVPSSTTEKLLITKKYVIENFQDLGIDAYIVEFHKKLNWTAVPTPNLYFIDIISRRKLKQISEDLNELNNIQRSLHNKREVKIPNDDVVINGYNYFTYESELNKKFPTDSYAKILLSDVETVENLTGLIYVDYKNELSFNVTRLDQEIIVPISNTGNFGGKLFIFCSEKHGLKNGDGVVLEFNGGVGSSQELNSEYFGYKIVNVVNEYNFYLNQPYGNIPQVGNDTGFVKYIKTDPFFNYQPVDLIDMGADKRGKQSIEIDIDNLKLSGRKFSLQNVDFSKFRFRLIDGLDFETLSRRYSWLLEAEISDATIGQSGNEIVWYKGIWESGRWFGGRWVSGTWITGDWYDGVWDSKYIENKILTVEINEKSESVSNSKWFGGRWFAGTWNNGNWINGRWYGGTWNNGLWYKGIWNDGTWNDGEFQGGIWVQGTWNAGYFNTDSEPAYWLDGEWYSGDFENGMWYNGTFDQKEGLESRFGINSFNSRTSTWHSGKWINGSFHSRLNLNDVGQYDVSDIHKYSMWYTGQWFSGDFYGGIAYNMKFVSGTWHGGILEDIQVIGFTGSTVSSDNYFTLNGIFKFNIGDEITIIDNQVGNLYSQNFGSNDDPKDYKVLYTVEDTVNKRTKVYVNKQIPINLLPPVDTRLRVVSRFKNCNWKSGIWTNGIYEKGFWEGGIWYNGIFEDIWM
jgi:hypothetical protein